MKPLWRSVIIGTALLLGGIVAVDVASNLLASSLAKQELVNAKSRWAARDFNHYRMVVETNSTFSEPCRQEVEIQNEKVINAVHNCKSPIPSGEESIVTIANLFNQLETHTSKPECGPNGCACDGVINADIIYDQQLGYPRQIEVKLKRLSLVELWLHPQGRREAIGMLRGGPCTLIGLGERKVKVLSLEPFRAVQKTSESQN